MPKKNPNKEKALDPYFGLKYIAYCRTGFHIHEEEVDHEYLVHYAKQRVCRVRSVLFNDPMWDRYTDEEILIEFFALRFEENIQEREIFQGLLVKAKEADIDWMERQERRMAEEAKQGTISEGPLPKDIPQDPGIPEEFEDKF